MNNSYKYQLTVIIVNYNVEYFLDQCLSSVKEASKNLKVETIVVDNNSIDGSIKMLKENHPEVPVIENKENLGFSKANNIAIQQAEGEFILLLNPDTVVAEDTFDKTVEFLKDNPDYGGLGVRMVDGKGRFLPESKRGLPTPTVAFYKISGLSKIFPKSKKFSKYHAGHLKEDESGEVDILSGAFMMIRKSVLDKIGLLDETFFMYGEDIDLSYRIQLGGYKNHYAADTAIIHYKGESTKKSSVNYVFVFYRAMIIFAQKHFAGKHANLFSFIINTGIYLRAGLAIGARIIKSLLLPTLDFTLLLIGLFALTRYWTVANIDFPLSILKISIPTYALTWIGSVLINGGYDKPIKLSNYFKGTLIGTALLLIVYAIIPKDYQFSRLFIFIGSAWVILYYLISRVFIHFAVGNEFKISKNAKKNFQILGSKKDFEEVKSLLIKSQPKLGALQLVKEVNVKDEVVFCSTSLSYKEIISQMIQNRGLNIDFKIKPKNRDFFIGSNSIETTGELYIIEINNLVSAENKRKKRLFDVFISIFLIASSLLFIWFYQNKKKFFQNTIDVLLGRKTLIGFSTEVNLKDVRLPKIKEGVVSPCDVYPFIDESTKEKLNLLYARDYSLRKDFSILWRSRKQLDK